jgi:pyruvate kinase
MIDVICTIGPSTFAEETLRALMAVGVTRFRLSLAKEPLARQLERIAAIRSAASGRPIEVIVDVAGVKPRLTNTDPMTMQAGDTLRLALRPSASSSGAALGITDLPAEVSLRAGDRLLTGDGELAFQVERVDGDVATVTAENSGALGPRRGVTPVGRTWTSTGLLPVDIEMLEFAASADVDAVMLSFVESPEVIQTARLSMTRRDSRPTKWYAKLETRRGVEAIDRIAAAADHVVLGRGDLLLETGIADFADVQSRFHHCADKPKLVVATQLFNSVASAAMPNRAELTAFHYHLSHGIRHYLLSRETTVGVAPVRTVQVMNDAAARWVSA